MRRKTLPITFTSFIAVVVTATAFAHSGATGIVKERMDWFVRSKDHLKSIKTHLQNSDFDAILPHNHGQTGTNTSPENMHWQDAGEDK